MGATLQYADDVSARGRRYDEKLYSLRVRTFERACNSVHGCTNQYEAFRYLLDAWCAEQEMVAWKEEKDPRSADRHPVHGDAMGVT
eukprot:9654892-Alexandrium_andersonii.AAC.1